VDVPDFSGNERHGYYKGTARCVDDGSGPAGLYYAADGASMIESDWIPGELTGSYSVAAWFEGHDAASTNEVIFGSYADGSAPGFVLQFVGDPRHGDDQLLAFHVSKTSPFTYSSVKSPQSYHEGWHQAVLVFEEAVGLRLYVDGDFVAENTSLGEGIGEFALPFTAGGQAYKTERNFNGGLDEILVYDRALTAGEIAGLYANTIPAGALLHWGCIPEPGVAVFLAGLVFAGLFRRNRRA